MTLIGPNMQAIVQRIRRFGSRLDTGSMLEGEGYVGWIERHLEGFPMFGKHHEPAQATVLDVQDVSGTWEELHHVKKAFVLEVHPPTGQAFRATATHHFLRFTAHPVVGEMVQVKYDPTSLKVELDLKDDPRYGKQREILEEQAKRQEVQARRAALLAAPPGMPPTSGNLLSTLTGHTEAVNAVAWSPDGRLLASGGADCTLRIWNPDSRQSVATLDGEENGVVLGVAWSPDGHLVAFGNGNTQLWNATLGERLPPLIQFDPLPDETGVTCVAWSPDSRFLASGATDSTICLWDVIDRTKLATLKGHHKRQTREVTWIRAVAWSPDGRFLASVGDDNTVCLWEVRTGQTVAVISSPSSPSSVAWSPDGRLLATSGAAEPLIWDASTGKQLLYKWAGHGIIWAAVWSPDGRLLATANYEDQTVGLWDVHQGQHLATLYGHTNHVLSVAWSPDGHLLASGSDDTTVRLWRVE